MVILINSGSTHNFLDVALWKVLQVPISTQDCFEVKVANGAVLKIEGDALMFNSRFKALLLVLI